MSLYTIGDLHLHFQSELKSEEQLHGKLWKNHEKLFQEACSELLREEDTLVLAGDLIRALVIILLGGLLLKAYPGIGRRTALLFGIVGQTLPITNAMRARHGLVFPALLLLWTDWRLFLIALIVFLAVYIATKRISVSTLAAAVCFIIFSLVLGTWLWGVKLILAVLAAAALVLPYWGNLRRYFSGLKKKKSEDEEVI